MNYVRLLFHSYLASQIVPWYIRGPGLTYRRVILELTNRNAPVCLTHYPQTELPRLYAWLDNIFCSLNFNDFLKNKGQINRMYLSAGTSVQYNFQKASIILSASLYLVQFLYDIKKLMFQIDIGGLYNLLCQKALKNSKA